MPKAPERIETTRTPTGARLQLFNEAEGAEPSMEIEVDFAGLPVEVHAVHVRARERLTGAALQRLPWARYLAAADAIARVADAIGGGSVGQFQEAARRGARATGASLGEEPVSARPGRKPLPDEHYREIAERYLALRRQGSTNPVAALAKERNENRNTVAAKVRKARERGYLLEGRPGRAG
jgi:hypothetical protein